MVESVCGFIGLVGFIEFIGFTGIVGPKSLKAGELTHS